MISVVTAVVFFIVGIVAERCSRFVYTRLLPKEPEKPKPARRGSTHVRTAGKPNSRTVEMPTKQSPIAKLRNSFKNALSARDLENYVEEGDASPHPTGSNPLYAQGAAETKGP